MKTKTAIQWLMEQLTYKANGKDICWFKEAIDVSHLYEQAKEMEKKQIMDAYNKGYRDGESAEESTKSVGDISEFWDSEDYFNKTFNR
jgi:hypothetical protein